MEKTELTLTKDSVTLTTTSARKNSRKTGKVEQCGAANEEAADSARIDPTKGAAQCEQMEINPKAKSKENVHTQYDCLQI